jgi:hypothetical protein
MDTRGWNDIAYSFLINHEGTIYEGRGAGIAGGHTAGHNTVSHAICLLGNYDNATPTVAAMRSIVDLARYGHVEGWWREGFTGGHRDASGASTSCPGRNLHSQISTLNQSITSQPIEEDEMFCKKGDTNRTVEHWQRIIIAINPALLPSRRYQAYDDEMVAAVKAVVGGTGVEIGPGQTAALTRIVGSVGESGTVDQVARDAANAANQTLSRIKSVIG